MVFTVSAIVGWVFDNREYAHCRHEHRGGEGTVRGTIRGGWARVRSDGGTVAVVVFDHSNRHDRAVIMAATFDVVSMGGAPGGWAFGGGYHGVWYFQEHRSR